jgi:hypothetical protein
MFLSIKQLQNFFGHLEKLKIDVDEILEYDSEFFS